MSTSSLQAEKTVYTSLTRREERSLNNNLFLGEYECSSLALDRDERRDEKKRLYDLKQDQTIIYRQDFQRLAGDSPGVTTPATAIAVNKDEFLEVRAQLELYGSILHDHTQRLDALPPTLLEGMGWDITELYDRYEDQREIHALRMQHAADEHEMQELRECVAALERRMDHFEE
ncbi:hypothetical protein Tco_0642736 [Tanacetum coccineum]